MSRYSVAIVLLSLVAGGIVGIVYENARQGPATAEGVAGTEVSVGACGHGRRGTDGPGRRRDPRGPGQG